MAVMIGKGIHGFLYRFFTGYGLLLFILFWIVVGCVYILSVETTTSRIKVSTDRSALICQEDIEIYTAQSADEFLGRLFDYEDMSLERMICTVDDVYNGSASDKQAVANFVDNKLSFWPFRREDIATYFLQKIQADSVSIDPI